MAVERVFLIGFMGSGKSTLGRWLKNALGWSFIDMDEVFEAEYKTTIKQFFADKGEAAFREAERAVLHSLLNEKKAIIATGGGAPCFFDNLEVMNKHGLTIYLKLSVDGIISRISGGKNVRPLVAEKSGDELRQFITEKLIEREPFYTKARVIADAEVLGVEGYVKIIEQAG